MYKLYKVNVTNSMADRVTFTLITEGTRGKLGPLMDQLSRSRDPYAIYDINNRLVSRSW